MKTMWVPRVTQSNFGVIVKLSVLVNQKASDLQSIQSTPGVEWTWVNQIVSAATRRNQKWFGSKDSDSNDHRNVCILHYYYNMSPKERPHISGARRAGEPTSLRTVLKEDAGIS